jgi:type II secretory pathway pseudopilin PulG
MMFRKRNKPHNKVKEGEIRSESANWYDIKVIYQVDDRYNTKPTPQTFPSSLGSLAESTCIMRIPDATQQHAKPQRGKWQHRRDIPPHPLAAVGITMAELLIALIILAEIATFTIPKVLYSTQISNHYAVAMEILGALSTLTYNYTLTNGGCFAGNITCKIDPSTGATLDGKPNLSTPGSTPDAYNQFVAYLDDNLNYAQKGTVGTMRYYYLHNNALILFQQIGKGNYNATQKEVFASFMLYLDTSPDEYLAGHFSAYGVDTSYAYILTFRHGVTIGGENAWSLRRGLAYANSKASIYDLKDHPEHTCSAVGGFNCGW